MAFAFDWAESAGTIASSSGSASIEAAPRNTTRREMTFFVMIIGCSPLRLRASKPSRSAHDTHAEWFAPHDAEYERRPSIIGRRAFAGDLPDCGQIVIFDTTADAVRQKFFGERSHIVILVTHQ